MSIYSGFPTRKDQQKYNSLLSKLILTLQTHLLQLIPSSFSSSKAKIYSRLIAKMRDFQQHKYLPPKFSQLLDPLAKKLTLHLGQEQRLDTSEEDLKVLLKENGKEKFSTPSLYGLRNKAQTVISVQGSQEIRPSKVQNIQEKRMMTEAKFQKKMLFDGTSHHPIRAKINKGIIVHNDLSRKSQGQQSQSEQTREAIQNWMTFNKQRGKNSKNGSKFRYKAYNALEQAQNNISKRNIPLRQQMRRKLKTQGTNAEL